ncbi:uncharacterized protein LOC125648967 isoform X2 [Ostrea edulis]|uniref:uncharacterized protein LOC125648967 isoform X2 n=1 Tax=Ostrea edulis TaxID=37623 RepID=UPI0024AF63A3|nr:uncharacterized protein LOC125648967 isoform X2 [Ostrea edulis]
MKNTFCFYFSVFLVIFSALGRHVQSLTCLRCSDITEPRLCNKIEHCHDGEVCAVQQYRADNGDIGYWTGCYPQKECAAVDNRTVITTKRSQYIDGVVQCRDCCTTDICNAYGCGTPKYPDTRGPICFDCEDVADPTDCHTITPCDLNQKCMIHERTVFGQKYFTSKCESVMGCFVHFTGPVVGRKRDLNGVCLHCCDGDLCNANCSSASSATINKPNVPVMPEHVAFHAVAYSSTSVTDIIFDHVITNIGDGYDNATGVFTVPTTGLYVFSWTIEAYGQLTEGALLVNGVQNGQSRAHESTSHYDTTTSFAVLNLTITDKVSVRVIRGRAEARHTMFSGWKINKTDDTAFDASLSRDVSGSHIVYDNETLDTDNSYSPSTGNFVAPRSGLYVFMMSAVNFGSYEYSCKFRLSNGKSQPDVWVDSQSGYYDSSSYMTFAWLNAGEYVYVYADKMRKTSVFAGWQLVNDMSVSKSTYPAFLASLGSDFSSSPVVFGSTYSGYHHGYSTSTGIFTADRDGVYVFLYNIEAQSELVRTTLRVNGVDKFELRSDGRSTGYDDTSAVSVLQLSPGDQVSVERKYGTVDGGQSLFFGVLLFEM